MSHRPDLTLILITNRVVLRADVDNRQNLTTEPVTIESSAAGNMIDEIQRVLDGGAPLARKVAVLSTSVWNQLVSIPRLSIDGLDDDQLRDALKYEVEPLLGIQADLATLSFSEIAGMGDHRRFWVNVLPSSDWQSVRGLLKSKKARDIQITHPVVVSNQSEADRLEFWDDTIFFVDSDGYLKQMCDVGAATDRWVSDFGFASSQQAFESTNTLFHPDAESAAKRQADADRMMDLSSSQTQVTWLQTTAKCLAESSIGNRPIIQQPSKKTALGNGWLLKVASVLLVVTFCAWHLSWLKSRNQQMEVTISELKIPLIEKSKHDGMLQGLMQKRDQAISEGNVAKQNLQRVRFLFEGQTSRIHMLLNKLVEFRTPDLVVKEIVANEDGTMISGVSLDSDAAPLLTNRLRDALTPVGWRVHPASQQGQLKMTSGGPWTFSILLQDVGPPSLIKTQEPVSTDNRVRP